YHSRDDECTDDSDAANGVGTGHERRVQRLRHLTYDLDADEGSQHKDDDVFEHGMQWSGFRGAFKERTHTVVDDGALVSKTSSLEDLVFEVGLEGVFLREFVYSRQYRARVHVARVHGHF